MKSIQYLYLTLRSMFDTKIIYTSVFQVEKNKKMHGTEPNFEIVNINLFSRKYMTRFPFGLHQHLSYLLEYNFYMNAYVINRVIIINKDNETRMKYLKETKKQFKHLEGNVFFNYYPVVIHMYMYMYMCLYMYFVYKGRTTRSYVCVLSNENSFDYNEKYIHNHY